MKKLIVLSICFAFILSIIQSSALVEAKTKIPKCSGTFESTVNRIVDGDTLYAKGCNKSIRLSLVNTPERKEPGYLEAKSFVEKMCPVKSKIKVDQDNNQPYDSRGRIVAVVYCGESNLNAKLLRAGLADVLKSFCSVSEFSNDRWAIGHCS